MHRDSKFGWDETGHKQKWDSYAVVWPFTDKSFAVPRLPLLKYYQCSIRRQFVQPWQEAGGFRNIRISAFDILVCVTATGRRHGWIGFLISTFDALHHLCNHIPKDGRSPGQYNPVRVEVAPGYQQFTVHPAVRTGRRFHASLPTLALIPVPTHAFS